MHRRSLIVSLACVLVLPLTGCATPESPDEPLGENSDALKKGPSCDPARANGAVNRYQKALHDSLAFAEGTEGRGKDGYDIGFAYKKFTSCSTHPNMKTCSGSLCSTAAGRYQFLKKSWDPVSTALDVPTFEPENQEKGAEYQIKKTRKVTVPTTRALTATEFSNAMKKLSYEWASLPPGRYGQPNRTEAALRKDYCNNLAEDAQGC